MRFRNFLPLIMALSLIFAISSCEEEEFQSSENSITKFVINGQDCEIDKTTKTIVITVPTGTDVTKLKPSVQISDKAWITPSTDQETDFSNPVVYTVTAQDGSKAEYTVIVKKAEVSEKRITGFTINNVEGVIDEEAQKITLNLPFGTDVTKLAPSIITSPQSSVSPASGAETDFSAPVEYTVTALDGTSRKYTVEVVVGVNSAKAITAFTINNATGSIDEENKTITISLPYGYDLTKLTPKIEVSAGASVSPASEAQVDLSNPVKYTVTAEDGTKAEYTVCVILGKNTQKEFVAFSINDVKGTIDEVNKKITVYMPAGTDASKLKPVFTASAGASVSPASETQVDLTKPVEYTITAEDGSTAKYTVVVSVEKYNEKAITKFTVNDIEAVIDEANKTIAFTLPTGTDVSKLKPSVTISQGASLSPASGTEVDFTNPVEYTVTAEDGSTAKYTVVVSVEKYNEKAITKFTVNDIEAVIDEANKTIAFTLPTGTDVSKLKPSVTISQGASLSPASGTEVDFTNPVEYTVTAEDGSTAKYTATASVTKRSDKAITEFVVSGVTATIDEANKTIAFTLPAGTDVSKLKPSVTVSQGASLSPASETEADFTNPVEYTVTAEDGSTVKYTATASVTKRSDKAITKFTVNGVDATINEAAKTITYTLPAGADITKVKPTITVSAGATVNPASNAQIDFTNPVEYTVTAEDGSTAKYTATIKEPAFQPEITSVSRTSFEPVGDFYIILDGKFADKGKNVVKLYKTGTSHTFTIVNENNTSIILQNPTSIPAGEYTLSVTSDGVTTVYSGKITVIDPEIPVITSINKTSLVEGELDQDIILRGSNFTGEDIEIGYKRDGGSMGYLIVDYPLSINAAGTEIIFRLPADAVAGDYEIIVMKPRVWSNTINLTIEPGSTTSEPVITSLDKTQYTSDETIEITGTNLYPPSGSRFNVYVEVEGPYDYKATINASANYDGTMVTFSFPVAVGTGSFKVRVLLDGTYRSNWLNFELI